MTQPYPSDSRCWHCDRKRTLTWFVRTVAAGIVGAWVCQQCRSEWTL